MTSITKYFMIICYILKGNSGYFVSAWKEEQLKFYHYQTEDSYHSINLDELNSLNFKEEGPLFIVIDGFLSNFKASMSQHVKDGLLKSRPNGNVVVVDWSRLSGFESMHLDENTQFAQLMMVYNVAKSKVMLVGEILAKFLAELSVRNVISYSKVHIIGFSLGAHRITGLRTIERHNGRITRITGLDPAGPGFSMENPRNRLDKSDAEFVDIYHTNRYIAGDVEHHIGHVDVYVNGGKKQPGCTSPSLINSTICNHAFSWKAWNNCLTENCEACLCYSSECQNCSGSCTDGVIVGMDISLDATGEYYLKMEPLFTGANSETTARV